MSEPSGPPVNPFPSPRPVNASVPVPISPVSEDKESE